jgi:hypothetical protein
LVFLCVLLHTAFHTSFWGMLCPAFFLCDQAIIFVERWSSTLSLTSALGVWGWLTPCPDRYTPGNDSLPIVWEVGWAPGPVWMGGGNLAPHRGSIP